MAGYIGAYPLTKASYDKKLFIATAGQTLFNVAYNAHFLDVLVNGVEVNTSDYTATDGLTVEFVNPLTAGDEITFKIWGTFSIADTYIQNATSTVAGVVKMRLDGTTLYITNDGSDA